MAMKLLLVDALSTGNNLAWELVKRGHEVHHAWSSAQAAATNFKLLTPHLYRSCSIYPHTPLPEVDEIINASDSGMELADLLSKRNVESKRELRINRMKLVQALGEPASTVSLGGAQVLKPIRSEGGYDRVSFVDGDVAVPDGFFVMPRYDGNEYAIDTVSLNGQHRLIAIWRYYKYDNSYVRKKVELLDPRSLMGSAAVIFAYVQRVLDTAGYRTGAAHTEVIFDGKPHLVECNFRTHGHMDYGATRLALGRNQWQLLADALEGTLKPASTYVRHALVRRFYVVNQRVRMGHEVPWKLAEDTAGVAALYRGYADNDVIPVGGFTYRTVMANVILCGATPQGLDAAEAEIREILA